MTHLRRGWIWVLVLALLLMATGCRDTDRTGSLSQAEEETPEKLIVFDLTSDNSQLIVDYQAAHPEIALEIHSITGDWDKFVEKYGEPDIILGMVSLMDEYADSYALDMTKFVEADETDFNVYYPGVTEIGSIDNRIYALPLELSSDMIILTDSQLKGSAFEELSENYAAGELLDAMLKEMRKASNDGTMGVLGQEVAGTLLYEIGAITEENDELRLDKELFEKVWTVMQKGFISEATEYGYRGGFSFYSNIDLFGISEEEYKFMITNRWCPQEWLKYMNSLMQEQSGEAIHVFWKPMADSGKFTAWVSEVGMIGKNTAYPQTAYNCLRQMMDTPRTVFTFGRDTAGWVQGFPVNKEQALLMIDNVEGAYSEYQYIRGTMIGQTFPALPLSEELHTDLEHYLNNIGQLRYYDTTAGNIHQFFLQNGMMGAEQAYSQVEEIIKQGNDRQDP